MQSCGWKGWLYRKLIAVNNWLVKRLSVNRSNGFKPLTPALLEHEQIKEYEAELLNALHGRACPDVRNIAITGGFSVGKSSFLKSFQAYHPEFKYLTLSMARFDGAGEERKQSCIEQSILEQLLYSVKPRTLPNSKFKRVTGRTNRRIFAWLALVICCLLVLHEPTFTQLASALPYELFFNLKLTPKWPALLGLATSIFFLIRWLLRISSNFSFEKIQIKGAQLANGSGRSYLQENLDEILYFFEQSKANVVVIEDIDRLDRPIAISILTHLREVSRLLHQSAQISRPIFFIYALKDDLLEATGRTKFFDFLIPIIPTVNVNNAFATLKEELGEQQLQEIGANTVRDCALHFFDMRMLLSLSNEYAIYRKMIASDHDIVPRKLFALLAVKTLHPEVHAELLVEKGKLYEAIEATRSQRAKRRDKLELEKRKLEAQIADTKAALFSSKEELLFLFWAKCSEQVKLGSLAHYLERQPMQSQLQAGSSFEAALISGKNIILTNNPNNRATYKPINPATVVLASGRTYVESIGLLEHGVHELQAKLSSVQESIFYNNHKTISEILEDKTTREEVFSELHDFPIIKQLLLDGLLDEDYPEFMSFFKEGSMTLADKNKVLAIKRYEELKVDEYFDRPEEVIASLTPQNLTNGRGLLVGLMPELLKSQNDLKLQDSLRDWSDNLDRMFHIFVALKDSERAVFVRATFRKQPIAILNMLNQLIDGVGYPNVDGAQFVELLLNTCEFDELVACKGEKLSFKKLISKLKHLPAYDSVDKRFWQYKGFKYTRLESVTAEQARDILEFEQFAFMESMLKLLMSALAPLKEPNNLLSYDSVRELNLPGFESIVDENVPTFVSFCSGSNDWSETPESVYSLIEREELDVSDKVLIAKACQEKLNVANIPSDCINSFLAEDLIEPSWKEVCIVFELKINDKQIDENAVKSFIERNVDKFDDYREVKTSNQCTAYVLNLEPGQETFSKLVNMLEINKDVIEDLTLTNEDQWVTLAHKNGLKFSEAIFEWFQDHSSEAAAEFLLKDFKANYESLSFLSSINNDTFLLVLSSDKLSTKDKLQLIEEMHEVDFSRTQVDKKLAKQIVMSALEQQLSLPDYQESLVECALEVMTADESYKTALYYIENDHSQWDALSDMMKAVAKGSLNRIADVPTQLKVEITTHSTALLNKLETLGYIGTRKSKDDWETVYLKPSLCH